jgi:DNA-binding response OmpR family regulator
MTMESAKILLVEDDPAVRHLVHRFLVKQSYQVESTEDGQSALAIFEQFAPDLVILDINLPDINGYELCRIMQAKTGVYVLMLTSLTDEADKIRGFRQGADDYVTKPFSLWELKARIGAILKRQRRVSKIDRKCLTFDRLSIDPIRREVWLGQQRLPLTELEFDLLHCLASHPGRVWRRTELIQKVWDYDYDHLPDERVIDVHIGQIRRKIEVKTIRTIRGVGYTFEPPDPDQTAADPSPGEAAT